MKHNLAEWHTTAMKWQQENTILFRDNQKLFAEKKSLEADKRVLEASGPQADLIRQLAQRDTDMQKLVSDNTTLSQHNQALKKTCDSLRKEKDKLLEVITCSHNEATFNQLSIDYQRTFEANRVLAKQLQYTKGELEFIKKAYDIVLGQVQELQKAGYITMHYGGPITSDNASNGGPSSQPPSNIASPINPVHYSPPSSNPPSQMQPVPQALPQNGMSSHGPQMAHSHPTQLVVVPRRPPHPCPPPTQVQAPTQTQPQPFVQGSSVVPTLVQKHAPQPPSHSAPFRVIIPTPASSKPTQIYHYQSPNPMNLHQPQSSPSTAFIPTQNLNPNPPQSQSAGSPQTTISTSHMHIESSHIPSPLSSSHHPNMSQPHSSPLSMQLPFLPPQHQEQSTTLVPSATDSEARQIQMQEIPANPATGLTFKLESGPEVNAPPTPPRSLKSMSPEESMHGRLKRSPSPASRGSEDVGGDDRRKRIKLYESGDSSLELQTVIPGAEVMVDSGTRMQAVGVSSTGQGSSMEATAPAAILPTAVAEQPVAPVGSLSAPMEAEEEEEEEVIQLERGPDGLFKEEEVVPHLFESDGDNNEFLHCPFCLVKERATNMPPRNFADASITELLRHYKENHSHILAKVCQEGLDMLYSPSS
uniref:Uncharacterized protein n=1 Tax=Moniliophthora roreri TaxID=221103 RepID=A0A0W0GAM2_MONRR